MSLYDVSLDSSMDDGTPKYMLDDLQLAAELGKTLLERNKELEGTIKQQQIIIDDQSQEIEYLTKQNNALREVNDTRLKIYENIEISIQDLEKQNHRLTIDHSALKKTHKTLTTTNESLEEKCEELRKQIEELNREVEIERRKNERLQVEQRMRKEESHTAISSLCSAAKDANDTTVRNSSLNETDPNKNVDTSMVRSYSQVLGADEVDHRLAEHCDNEEILTIITELDCSKRELTSERQRVSELEDQLSSLIQDNRELQNRIAHNTTTTEIGEMRSMHDELSILEESGQGKMCRRCLRGMDDDTLVVPDYASSIACTEDGDDASLNELLLQRTNSVQNIYRTPGAAANQSLSTTDSTLDLSAPSPNPYRDLVDKYEALLEVHNSAFNNRNRQEESTPVSSLQDELLASGDFNTNKDTINADAKTQNKEMQQQNAPAPTGAKRKVCLRTPTDFSEAETSSSGFSDETSNKFTQTEETFLCTIADGEDKFSIYDEASPIDSRFRHCPKYRHLFKEIFATLKKAAENKDEGEKLPLLDDTNPAFKVPPVTPAAEELPNFPDETESIVSSVVSEQSVAMSECVTKHERKTAKKKAGQENKPPGIGKESAEGGQKMVPIKREPLEYLAFSNLRKKNKKRNRPSSIDPSDNPTCPSSPRFFYANARKRRDRTLYQFPNAESKGAAAGPSTGKPSTEVIWNGNSITVYNSTTKGESATGETKVYRTKSSAAHDIHKLIKLDLSYAEVLRRADQNNKNYHRRK